MKKYAAVGLILLFAFCAFAQTEKFKTAPSADSQTKQLLTEAENLIESKRYDEANQIIRQVMSTEPTAAQAYFLQGKIRLQSGRLSDAIYAFKTAIFWDSKLVVAYTALGTIYLKRSDCGQAKQFSSSALKLDSNNKEALKLQKAIEQCKN